MPRLTEREQKTEAKKFAERWSGKGDEKEDSQKFWIDLLQNVLGVENVTQYIDFEKKVKVDGNVKFIDVYIPSVNVIIEQKSLGKKLREDIRQSDGTFLSPYKQAKRYNDDLRKSEKASWIITCNFSEFLIYDMEKNDGIPKQILLKDLENEYHRLQFLVDSKGGIFPQEVEISKQAGALVGKLYDAILKQYKNPDSSETLRSLNVLCVRLVFCLYAEDAGVFGKHDMFGLYLKHFDVRDVRKALIELFEVLDTKPEDRDPYMDDELAAFPYVNGGLFADGSIEIPRFNEEIVSLLVDKASAGFNWTRISPTIFGALFESTLNPETRRKGGMHYTSIENIHKVIDPLFLDDLNAEFGEILDIKQRNTRYARLADFQKKLASLVFLDPACGSGNFLTETYISLRRLENKVIKEQISIQTGMAQTVMGGEGEFNPIKVSIGQFYGIEINDFAVTVARTALWIAESQMLHETEEITQIRIEFLPLKSYPNIAEGNALRLDWEEIVPKERLSFIMGNPPFVGYSLQSKEQKSDILSIYVDEKGKPYKTAGKIDYVSGWYFKASRLMQNTSIKTAFVSTNSITQGEQVAGVWKPLYDRFCIHIDFAYRTFRWDSEASLKAHVHCVIVGFSCAKNVDKKQLFDNNKFELVDNINAYLIEAPDVFIQSSKNPICDVPKMTTGNRPADGGNLIIEAEDYDAFIKKEPNAQKYIKQLTGALEFINNKKRYCLWLVGVSPMEIRKMPEVMKRVEACKQDRLAGAPDRQKLADTPTVFREQINPKSYIIVPRVSSENRHYIPLGFLDDNIVPTDSATIIVDAGLYHFGILTSSVHMAWMRTVCGRLKSDYRYSKDIVYNNFPWCTPTDKQKSLIEQTAQEILDTRAKYPECSLADLYDENTMPPDLRKAHQKNDQAVMTAYGFKKDMTESEIVGELMRLYRELMEK